MENWDKLFKFKKNVHYAVYTLKSNKTNTA